MREKIFFIDCPRCGYVLEVLDTEFGTAKCKSCEFEFEVTTADFEKALAAYLDMPTMEEPIMDKEKKYRADFEIRPALSPKTNLVTAMQAVAMRSISLMREKGLVKDGERISIEIDGDVYTF